MYHFDQIASALPPQLPAYLLITQISGAKKTLEEQKVFLVNRFDCLRGKLQLKLSQRGRAWMGRTPSMSCFPFTIYKSEKERLKSELEI